MTITTLTTVADATAHLETLANEHEWVSVFWDSRDRRTPEISIMVDGDGQNPTARLSREVYAALVDSGVVGDDTYGGFHNRRIHDFKTPPVPEKTGLTSGEVAETLIRDLIADHPDLPIRAAFFRGINKGNTWNPINEEIVETPAARGGWFVYLAPGHSDVALSAQEPTLLGPDIIGRGIADRFPYPQRDGAVDVGALAGDDFRAVLLAEIRNRVTVIDEAKASR